MDTIEGYIEEIVFSNQENGFTVAKLQQKNRSDCTTIVGSMPLVKPGETLKCQGNWKTHPSFGKQLEVLSYEVQSPADLIGIQKYLESGLIKGIGPVFAKKIVSKFGLQTLNVLDNDPHELEKIPGFGPKKIEKIALCWKEQKTIRQVMIFLQSFGVSPAYAQKIFKGYGPDSIAIVKENPYRLAREINGIGFKIADDIAQKMGFKNDSSYRIQAGLEFALWELANEGHVCYPKKDLIEYTEKILSVDASLIEKEILSLVQQNRLHLAAMPKDNEETIFVWLGSLYFFEQKIASELQRLASSPCKIRSIDQIKALDWVQKKLLIQLAEKQKEAVIQSFNHKIHIITGGPGTGKSTITNAILAITEQLTDKIILAAPTGRAAKRMTQITHKKAFTIHALLEYDFINKTFKRNQENTLNCHLIVIDEASMIDTLLFYHLLMAIPDGARVLFVGDIDQLPSIGPGNILKDLIQSNKFSCIMLNEIFRQAQGSKIILNAHRINQGLFPVVKNSKSDFIFIEENDPEKILEKIKKLLQTELKEKYHFSLDQAQVLSPMKKGIIGIDNLNPVLQNLLNPSDKPLLRDFIRLHLNDKVMQIKNNYTKMVYNGDIGYVKHIDRLEQEVIIDYDGKEVLYDFNELDEITLSYAISVHKYQGSECPCIIMPIHTCHFKLLYRNLLYTAITRGKKCVILIGTKQALALAIKNRSTRERYTGLQKALNSAFCKS
jgi:exodeoxyribonuclease V alpha subunit